MPNKFDSAFKENLISILTNDLKMLRSKAGLTQNELANKLGVSRQLYAMVENKTQRMTWSNFLALLFIFKSNPETDRIINLIGASPPELEKFLKHPNGALKQNQSGGIQLSDDEMDFVAAAGDPAEQENNINKRRDNQ